MTRRTSGFALLIAFLFVSSTPTFFSSVVTAVPPASNDSPLARAELAWERGDYPVALRGYLQILDAPGADAALDAIALRTGELFQTTEVTADGLAPQFSPDDRHFLYEQGIGMRRVTRLLEVSAPTRVVTELKGWGAAFSPDGAKIAFVQAPAATPEMDKAQAALEAAQSGTTAERNQRTAALNELVGPAALIVVRDIASGRETSIDTGTVSKASVLFGAGETIVFAGANERGAPQQIYVAGAGKAATAVTTDATEKVLGALNRRGTSLLFTTRLPGTGRGGRGGGVNAANATSPAATSPAASASTTSPAGAETAPVQAAAGGRGRGAGGAIPPTRFGVMAVPDGTVTMVTGSSPAFSGDGGTLVFVGRTGDEQGVMAASSSGPGLAAVVRKGPERIESPAASDGGSRIAFQMMSRDDWEIVTVGRDGTGETRLTRDPQHDLLPQFLSGDRLLSVVGEARHRRSFVYDLATGQQVRLFHNNTVRTIAPEYSWESSGDGNKLLIVAERDGNTVSLERGVYLVDLTKRVTREEVRARVAASLAAEESLRARGQRVFAPLAAGITAMVAEASVPRVYAYQKALFAFDSKHITRPGNKLASAYLFDTYKSFGYEPEMQWFDRENALGGRTANVLAKLTGTVHPEVIYVVSSHYDSVAIGPGADDDSSGTAALLETARIMAQRPQPATIIFASFTGEEAGLLGSREFVRRAVAEKLQIVGALNNDMVGWANDFRLDNTIRYSNPGIRDIQHAAAMQFSRLITYDALYYKGTDAAAYYEAFGDIVGGIGSYPVLSSPHYHQSHDVLENMNHDLITEVAKTTAATLTVLASSPSRVTKLQADSAAQGTAVMTWNPSPEKDIASYVVTYGPVSKPDAQQVKVAKPTVTLKGVAPGTVVAVRAINARGLESWDAARTTIK